MIHYDHITSFSSLVIRIDHARCVNVLIHHHKMAKTYITDQNYDENVCLTPNGDIIWSLKYLQPIFVTAFKVQYLDTADNDLYV